jgi:hypothetical protein
MLHKDYENKYSIERKDGGRDSQDESISHIGYKDCHTVMNFYVSRLFLSLEKFLC